MAPHETPRQMVEAFTKVTGQPAVHDPITPEEFGVIAALAVGPGFVVDAQQQMEWASVAPADKVCYGVMDPGECNSMEDLGLKPSTFEDGVRRSRWNGPE